jgi:Mce-associated membrane protein
VRRHWPLLLLVVGVVVLVSGLVAWRTTVGDEQLQRAAVRDEVVAAATEQIATLNSLDYRDVDAGLQAWADATTGTLHDQLVQAGEQDRQLLVDQQKISEAEVLEAAVLELDDDTATVVAAVEVSIRDGATPDAEPELKRNRFSAQLVRTDGEWRLEDLGQVAVGAA